MVLSAPTDMPGPERVEWCGAQAFVPTAWMRIPALGLEYGNLSCLISMNFSFLICEKGINYTAGL